MKTVKVPLSELLEVYDLLERLNQLLHQPMHLEDPQLIEQFADHNYPIVRRLYYDVVWNWLPPDVQNELEER